jgi:hypothetical protein
MKRLAGFVENRFEIQWLRRKAKIGRQGIDMLVDANSWHLLKLYYFQNQQNA